MSENCKSLVLQDKSNIEIFLSPATALYVGPFAIINMVGMLLLSEPYYLFIQLTAQDKNKQF